MKGSQSGISHLRSADFHLDLETFSSLDSMEGVVALDVSEMPKWLEKAPFGRIVHAIYPGMLSALVITLTAYWIAGRFALPVMLVALVCGMAFRFLHFDGRCTAGLEFASRQVLQLGVVLLGTRITVTQLAALGGVPIAIVMTAVTTTVIAGLAASKTLGLTRNYGLLSGTAVAICGSSAALAVAALLPRRPDVERELLVTIVSVTALSTLAMMGYPFLARLAGLDQTQAGIFLGGTIHNVPQAVGAGFMISSKAGDVATYIKLLRVATLVPLVLGATMLLPSTSVARRRTRLIPGFLIGFILIVVANSARLLPPAAISTGKDAAEACLVISITALGTKTSFRELLRIGWRPLALVLAETAWMAIIVFVAVRYLV